MPTLSHLISPCREFYMTAKGFYWRGRISHWRLLLRNSSTEWFFSLYSCIFTCKWIILLGYQRTAQKLKINSHCPWLSQVLGLKRTNFICLVFYFSLYYLISVFLSVLSFRFFKFNMENLSVRTFNQKKLFFKFSNFVEDFFFFFGGHFCL